MPAAPLMAEDGPRHRRIVSRATAEGFTLLEVLVAFVIAGIALAVLYNSGLSGLLMGRTASHYEQAVSRARSHLALAVHAEPLTAGDRRGDDGGGFTWHLRVTPLASTRLQPAYVPLSRLSGNFNVSLFAVSVSIAWSEGGAHEVSLETEQIGQGGS